MRKNRKLLIVVFVLIAVLSVGLICTVCSLNRNIKTRDIAWTEYSVGAFDESGKIVEDDKSSLITKDFITVEGMKIELEEDAEITYKVFFYNEDQEFISSQEGETEIVEGAKYMRIQITPTADEDGEISLLEKSGYAKQLSVTVNK